MSWPLMPRQIAPVHEANPARCDLAVQHHLQQQVAIPR